ncbi:hypothetical protein ACJRO7_027556 [Eucalyptus globulus]|uniref:Alpha/beta hydrolase fold-3 domain-containing protein n=1 Tax=Eucalyptus globulus TaxID=34317 RepID=A0ABD3K1U5_EUCGL
MQEHNKKSCLTLFVLLLNSSLASTSVKNLITETEVAHDLLPAVRIYKDGRVERLVGTATVSPSLGEKTGVQSKDVAISSDSSVSARLYIPKAAIGSLHKLPVPVYFHRGGFTFETAQSPTYHNYLNALVAEANITDISVDYRRAPKHPLPTAYNDSWTSLKWVAAHFAGNGPEEWLNSHANLSKCGNIVHNMGIQLGEEKLNGVEIAGAIMVLFFLGNEPLPWHKSSSIALCITGSMRRPLHSLMLGTDPRLSSFGVDRVLIFSGWSGVVDVMEAPREDHLFHLLNPSCDNAERMMKKLASFMSEDN